MPAVGYHSFHFFIYNFLLTSPPFFIRIQFKTFKSICVISAFYKAFDQFSSRSIELILKQFLNYQAEENPCCIFFLELLISSSSILLSFFDTKIMNCLARHKNRFFILKESSKCHNINYRPKNHVVMFCFATVSPNTDLPAGE